MTTMDGTRDAGAELLAELEEILGVAPLTSPEMIERYATDWTRRWRGEPLAVVRPQSVEAVSRVVAACAHHGIAVVPQGGNTGLVAGAVPPPGAVVVSTEALKSVEGGTGSTVTVGAGTTLTELREIARERGMDTGLMLASGDSATVGGVVATNAGGARVVRYGNARARVAGIRAVTSTGEVLDRRWPLPKDNTGYDLVELLVGSEGTLALITDVTWRLVRPNAESVVAVLAFDDAQRAVAATLILRELAEVEAVEWARGSDVQVVAQHVRSEPPMAAEGFWLFVEFSAPRVSTGRKAPVDLMEVVQTSLDRLIDERLLDPERIRVADAVADRRRLWRFREQMTESIAALGVPVKLDVAVPLDRFASVCDELSATVVERGDARLVLFGHLAEGNFHVNVLPEGADPFDDATADDIERSVLEAILAADGTVSAEHGVGRAKTKWLVRQRGEAEVSLMRRIKSAWDPDGIFNPGALLPAAER